MSLFPLGFNKAFSALKIVSKRQVFGVFFSLFFIVLPLVLVLVYQIQSRSLVNNTFANLEEITVFKQNGIEAWLEERTSDIRALVEPVGFSNLVDKVAQQDPHAEALLADQLSVFQNVYGYGNISLLGKRCESLYQTLPVIQLSSHSQELCKTVIQKNDLLLSDLIKPDTLNSSVHFDLAIPVFQKADALKGLPQTLVGVLILHIDPYEFLVPFMALQLLKAQEGKTFILQRTPTGFEPVARPSNGVAYEQVSGLIQAIHSQERQLVGQGQVFLEMPNKRVFLVHHDLASTRWVLVSIADADLIFSDLYKELLWIFLVGFLVLFLIGWALVSQIIKQHLAQEKRGLLSSHKALEKSRQYFMGLFMDSPVPYQSLDENGVILEVNQAWESLFGYFKEEVVGKNYQTFITQDTLQSLIENLPKLLATGRVKDVPFQIVRKDGERRHIRLQGRVSVVGDDQKIRTHCSLIDVTQTLKEQQQQAREVKRTETLFNLILHAQELSEEDLLKSALKQLTQLTHSKCSFLHFVDLNQVDIELGALEFLNPDLACDLFEKKTSIQQAGIWADSLRNRQAVLLNDYEAVFDKKGTSKAFSQLTRFISVPIFHNHLVQLIVGVADSEQHYDGFDVESIQLFGSELYQVLLLKRTHNQLITSEGRFHNLFDKAPVAYQSLDSQGRILEVNPVWLSLFGFDESQKKSLINRPLESLVAESSKATLSEVFGGFIKEGIIDNVYFKIVRQDGTLRDIEVTGRTSVSPDQGLITHCMLADVTEKIENNKALKLAAKVFECSGEGIIVTDNQQKIVSVNAAFTAILGYSKEEVLGKTPEFFKSGKHDKAFYEVMWRQIGLEGFWQGELWNRHKDGRLIPELLTITTLCDDLGNVQNYIGVFADITQLKTSEAELQFIAYHDPLTELPNRNKFVNHVGYAMTHNKRNHYQLAVLMLDLDRFKHVNDSYGHAFGDELLLAVSKQLLKITQDVNMLGRFGGDEFAVLIEDLKKPEDAARVARTIIERISQPQLLSNGKVVSVGCSIGIAIMGHDDITADQLIQQADTALYLAKKKGRGSFQYFSDDLTLKAQERIVIEVELKNAILNNELRVYFQPQVDIRTGHIKGAEALVRWQHPSRGLVMPGDFIGIAEESDLIAQIGTWVLQETCRLAKEWYDQGFTDLVYAVNVSPKQLLYSNMLKLTMDTLQAHDLPAEMLELEITESGLLTVGKDEAVQLLEQLRGLGVRIAIDDFGTGYSSLAYLKSLPLDVLKIDKQFVDDIPNDEKGMQIVSTIIAMGHNLKLKVLAEGVETQQQADFLKFKGCDFYQGYLTSPPVAAEVFSSQFLTHHRPSSKH